MDDYTPSTDEVRRIYVKQAALHGVGKSALHGFSAEAEFDRWFAEEIRKAKRDGYAEGHHEGFWRGHATGGDDYVDDSYVNPYEETK